LQLPLEFFLDIGILRIVSQIVPFVGILHEIVKFNRWSEAVPTDTLFRVLIARSGFFSART
jgi:hypothetical protein